MKSDQKIVVVGTGGTISSRYDASQGRIVASQRVEDIVALLPDHTDLPPLEFQNFATIAGFEMTLDMAHQLVKHVGKLVGSPEVAGLVIAQGTDTMEETSFLTDLLIPADKPVVFTGAQLPHDHPQADGPRNILDSIRAAVCVLRAAQAAGSNRSTAAWAGEDAIWKRLEGSLLAI
jgi:L-asparaginase